MNRTHICLIFGLFLLTSSCQAPLDDIYILYDNDVHCAIDGYEQMAALRADYLNKSIYVNVVSCGDFAQGNTVGSLSKGKYPVAIMNEVPYDYVTLGNHEFDYGIPQLKKLMRGLSAKCLCCNLTYTPTGENLYKPYDIRVYGTTYVAFIGVATPSTLTNSLPTNFQNEKGETVYDFHTNDLVTVVQQTINAAKKEGAEYVVLMSHLGDDTKGINSVDLIKQTTGITAVLDGHAHHVFNTKIANANGDSVIFASTGDSFRYVGCLVIAEDFTQRNELIDLSTYEGTNKRIAAKIASIKKRVAEKTSLLVGYSQVQLTDSDDNGNRLVRCHETNLGDFVSDAFRVMAKADVGVAIGGGLRHSLPVGNLTYGDILQVLPFNNTLYKVQVTGAQLVDNLEISVCNYPQESGDFMHVSGLRFQFDPSVPSPVIFNLDGIVDSIGAERRVSHVEIWRDTAWMPVAMDSTYTVGGQNYTLLCGGTEGLFQGAVPVKIEQTMDVDMLIEYIHQIGDTIRMAQYGESQARVSMVMNINN